MKTLFVACCCALFVAFGAIAQEAAPQQFWIRENVVKPSMSGEYEAGVKKVKDACTLHKVNISWTTVRYDDNTYVHLFPITGLGVLEKGVMSELQAKMGNEAFAALWPPLDKCVDGQNTVVTTWLPSFSYLSFAEGENHLELLFMVPLPGKQAEFEAVLGEWKKTYTTRKAATAYQTYRNMFGTDPAYVVVLPAKDPADLAARQMKTHEVAGDEIPKLWQKQMALSKKYYWKRGTVIPALGHQVTAGN